MATVLLILPLLAGSPSGATSSPTKDVYFAEAAVYGHGPVGTAVWLWEARDISSGSLQPAIRICVSVIESRPHPLFEYGCTDREGNFDQMMNASARALVPVVLRRVGSTRVLARSVVRVAVSWVSTETSGPAGPYAIACVNGTKPSGTIGAAGFERRWAIARVTVDSHRFGSISRPSDFAEMEHRFFVGVDRDLPAAAPLNGCY